jgi:hypothetical protein
MSWRIYIGIMHYCGLFRAELPIPVSLPPEIRSPTPEPEYLLRSSTAFIRAKHPSCTQNDRPDSATVSVCRGGPEVQLTATICTGGPNTATNRRRLRPRQRQERRTHTAGHLCRRFHTVREHKTAGSPFQPTADHVQLGVPMRPDAGRAFPRDCQQQPVRISQQSQAVVNQLSVSINTSAYGLFEAKGEATYLSAMPQLVVYGYAYLTILIWFTPQFLISIFTHVSCH